MPSRWLWFSHDQNPNLRKIRFKCAQIGVPSTLPAHKLTFDWILHHLKIHNLIPNNSKTLWSFQDYRVHLTYLHPWAFAQDFGSSPQYRSATNVSHSALADQRTFIVGKSITAGLHIYWFGFNQTSKSVVSFYAYNLVNPNQINWRTSLQKYLFHCGG